MLFAAFEKHQYYNIKDLVKITNQPVVRTIEIKKNIFYVHDGAAFDAILSLSLPQTYLKEILKELCVYNLKNPHKNMWELKSEYRCYKAEDKDD